VKKTEPVWILERVVLAAHARLLSSHGGAPGLRDPNLLQSALARPRQHYAYGSLDLTQLASLYTAGLIRNHPFIDGNKRTGFAIGIAFLELNGIDFRATEDDAVRAVFALAAGELDEAGYAAWLCCNSNPRTAKTKKKS
jgi:death-on-curing protein